MADSLKLPLLGRLAVHYKLVTAEQLREALNEQDGADRLGEILVAKGWMQPPQLDRLLQIQRDMLAKQRAKQAVESTGAPEAASPPAAAAEPATEPALENPEPAPAQPAPVASVSAAKRGSGKDQLEALLRGAVEAKASDLHVHGGAPVRLRLHGRFEAQGEPLDAETTERMFAESLEPAHWQILQEKGQIDFAYAIPGLGRFRVNVYRQQHGMDGVFRVVPNEPPTLDELGLPTSLAKFTAHHQGMVLVTGPAGCGKSSTMAALVDVVNEERSDHIITVEDPIEFVHRSKACLVNQRQVGGHTESFARALRAALREDPDVIAIGELRDLETISLALTAAETGHFVMATLHTNSAIRTINRLIGVFPPNQQGQIRTMVSESLKAVICQRLVPKAYGDGRVPALEVMVVNKAVGNLIRENKTIQLQGILQTGAAQGMCLLDNSLAKLVSDGVITREEALRNCEDPKRFGGTE